MSAAVDIINSRANLDVLEVSFFLNFLIRLSILSKNIFFSSPFDLKNL